MKDHTHIPADKYAMARLWTARQLAATLAALLTGKAVVFHFTNETRMLETTKPQDRVRSQSITGMNLEIEYMLVNPETKEPVEGFDRWTQTLGKLIQDLDAEVMVAGQQSGSD